MKAVRLIQIIVVLAAVLYLFLLHDTNDVNVRLPYLMSVPPSLVIIGSLVLGWLLGWLPPTLRGLRRSRELRRLRARVAELERGSTPPQVGEPETPVIPDRRPSPGVQQPYSEHENL